MVAMQIAFDTLSKINELNTIIDKNKYTRDLYM